MLLVDPATALARERERTAEGAGRTATEYPLVAGDGTARAAVAHHPQPRAADRIAATRARRTPVHGCTRRALSQVTSNRCWRKPAAHHWMRCRSRGPRVALRWPSLCVTCCGPVSCRP